MAIMMPIGESLGITQQQAFDFVWNNRQRLLEWLDQEIDRTQYIELVRDLAENVGMKNNGGIEGLACRVGATIPQTQAVVDEFISICEQIRNGETPE